MNTLAMTDKLQVAGVPERQARAQVEVLQEATDELATTADLHHLEAKLEARLREMEARLLAKIEAQGAALARQQLTMAVAMTAIFGMIVKFF